MFSGFFFNYSSMLNFQPVFLCLVLSLVSFFFLKVKVSSSIQHPETPLHVSGFHLPSKVISETGRALHAFFCSMSDLYKFQGAKFILRDAAMCPALPDLTCTLYIISSVTLSVFRF